MGDTEILFFVIVGVAAFVGWLFVTLVAAICRREINKALKGYIAGHVLRPRHKNGRFRSTNG